MMTVQTELGLVELEVQVNNKYNFDFTDNVKKDAIKYAAFYYIKQLYNNDLISKRQLIEIKRKYNIDID